MHLCADQPSQCSRLALSGCYYRQRGDDDARFPYDLPFKCGIALLFDERQKAPVPNDPVLTHQESSIVAVPHNSPSFAHVAPQCLAEAIAEAEILFWHILEDGGSSFNPTISFSNIELSTWLLNSYLSVNYKHGTLKAALELFSDLFVELDMDRDSQRFRKALEQCTRRSGSLLSRLVERYPRYDTSGGGCRCTDYVVCRVSYPFYGSCLTLICRTKNLDKSIGSMQVFSHF